MKLYRLDQNEYSDFTKPDRINLMLISAETEEQARGLAEQNELVYRDGEQKWTPEHAACKEITLPEDSAMVFLVS